MEDSVTFSLVASAADDMSLAELYYTSYSIRLLLQKCVKDNYFWYSRLQLLLGRRHLGELTSWRDVCLPLSRSLTRKPGADDFTVDVLGSLRCTQLLCRSHSMYTRDSSLFNRACVAGNASVLEYLMYELQAVPTEAGFITACTKGHEQAVALLLVDGRVHPDHGGGVPLVKACAARRIGVIKLLLADGRVDPGRASRQCLSQACADRQLEIVSLLMEDDRISLGSSFINDLAGTAKKKSDRKKIIKILTRQRRYSYYESKKSSSRF